MTVTAPDWSRPSIPTLTATELKWRTERAERAERSAAIRDAAIEAAGWLRDRLTANGWSTYRVGELINPSRTAVIRTGYAGGETEVELKTPQGKGQPRLQRLRLHRGTFSEMQVEILSWLNELQVAE